ncbi:MAG: hypothetical protein GX254_01215 [Clostridiales bacterium]|nr:hypothetical protein [Clostridiales bacterium]
MHSGYDIEITSLISNSVNIPVIASGSAGTPDHVAEVFQKPARRRQLSVPCSIRPKSAGTTL